MTDQDYREEEFEDALRGAFVEHRVDYIVLESRREQFQLASASWAEAKGWLACRWQGPDEQSLVMVCRLTEEGRRHFGIGTPEVSQ